MVNQIKMEGHRTFLEDECVVETPVELLQEIQKLALLNQEYDEEYFEMVYRCLQEPTLYSIKYLLLIGLDPVQFLEMAIEVGNFKAFILLLNRHACLNSDTYYDRIVLFSQIYNDLCPCMAAWGRVEFLEWWFPQVNHNSDMEDLVNPDLDFIAEEAARWGHLNILSWMIENGLSISYCAYRGAILGERDDVFQWLEEMKVPKRLFALIDAFVEVGDLASLEKYNFVELFEYPNLTHLIEVAFKAGQKESLKWLLGKYDHPEPYPKMIHLAIERGLEYIEILVDRFGDDEIHYEFMTAWTLHCAKKIPIESWQWFFDHEGQIDAVHVRNNLGSKADLIVFFLEELPVLCNRVRILQ